MAELGLKQVLHKFYHPRTDRCAKHRGRRISGFNQLRQRYRIYFELHLEGDFKKTKKLTWLAATDKNIIPVDLYEFDLLISKDKLQKDDELEDVLTPVTEFKTSAYADCNVAGLPLGTTVKFDRKGFYKLDASTSTGLIFFDIPTGRV
ncbi:MAG: hypothetical protein M1818_000157 [Claussenomyces sp. TS43310]|nr:MAG: hypothetical protein M1818_000157 [Claussenomyces sp. TS43310]